MASYMNSFVVVVAEPVVPCYFIFGDSMVDSGNNNNLVTHAKANYTPYGIDFPNGPTGRFTNGRTVADFIAEKLGFQSYIPCFASAKGSEILRGVNYASGSAGIRDETGEQQGGRISLNKQLRYHRTTISRIARILGNKKSAYQHLHKCLYSVAIGSNDYINNYFLPQSYNTSIHYNLDQYATVLADQFSRQLGAWSKESDGGCTGSIGCTPNATSLDAPKGSCVEKMNLAASIFNEKLKALVDEHNTKLKNATFVFVNTRKIGAASALSPAMKNIVSRGTCCQVGSYGLCKPSSSPPKDRDAFTFWDSFHPTEIVNRRQAERRFSNSDSSMTFPMDIRGLARL